MKENLFDILNILDSCASDRRGTGVYPVARVHCEFNGSNDSFWFTNRLVSQHNIMGLTKYGHFVPKNSLVAIKMQTNEVGSSFDYSSVNSIHRILNNHVVIENRSDFQNQTIIIAGDDLKYQYRNIRDFLKALQQNKADIEETKSDIAKLEQERDKLKSGKKTGAQKRQLTKTINELKRKYRILTQQEEDLKNITIYIRKQGEMRYSPIVDVVQTKIKSQHLFDGKTLIISGGPGTGKSTTMIHRLAYLTDIFAIDEDEHDNNGRYKLNATQRQKLREAIKTQRDWMFFSPSLMLKQYLSNAMKQEGLDNTDAKVWYWKDYCKKILTENYHILGENNAPFKVCNLQGCLFDQDSNIIDELENFYLSDFRSIKKDFPKWNGNVSPKSKMVVIAKGIEKRFEGCEVYNIPKFVSLFNSLESVYGNDCKELQSKRDALVSKVADEILSLLDKDEDIKSSIDDIFDLIDEDIEVQPEDEEQNIEEANSSDLKRRTKLIAWLKAFSYGRVNGMMPLSKDNLLISEIIQPILGSNYEKQLVDIGNYMIFDQFAKYTKGTRFIMLRNIPARYKKFRNHLIKTQFKGCDLGLLRDIIQRGRGKELHHQEQSLLLGFINNLVKQIEKSNANIKHPYIEAYEEVSRPIIGIDEATDFSPCDIYAMQSLLSQDFNSLTLCGDMMQRLTSYGITSWSQLNGIVQEPLVVEMKTSYRQSKRLLEVAKNLYRDTIGEIPRYKAFMTSSKVPAPLVYVDSNEYNKVSWISKRIKEVYRAYGKQLPSIAIFVNDKGYIPAFANELQKTEFFKDKGISVIDGLSTPKDSSSKYICVYPINVVKGMEFDVVFFHNIDQTYVSANMLRRYIYVGVSRAAFFLGITLSKENKEIEQYFDKDKDWFKI